jgi:hypothetical protein
LIGCSRIETVEDEQVAFGVVKRREGCDALKVIEGGEGVHLFVFDLVPGDVPAGVIGPDAYRKIHSAEVVADGRQTRHERELRAADGKNERIVGRVCGDDAVNLVGSTRKGVVRSADVTEGLTGVGHREDDESGDSRGSGKATKRALGCGVGRRS